jgi:MFS family permease
MKPFAVFLVFALSGIIFGTWSSSIPFIRHGLGLDEAQLGFVLLFFSVGVIIGNPITVMVLHHLGLSWSISLSLLLSTITFALTATATNWWLSVCFLSISGFLFSVLNVAMNSAAAWFEDLVKRKVMSTCHGMWSAGAMVGSAVCSAVLSFGISPFWWFLGGIGSISLISMMIAFESLKGIKSPVISDHTTESKFQWPNAMLWSVIFISLCCNLTEGTMADWAALFMRDEVGSAHWLEGWGFGVYAFFMAVTRFFGDRLMVRYTPQQILKAGGLLACMGLMLAIWTQTEVATLIGFGLVGCGVALGAPILYGIAARAPGMAPGAGLATMNTFAMVGFLSGPALIGFCARATSLPTALTIVAAVCLIWVWRATLLKPEA